MASNKANKEKAFKYMNQYKAKFIDMTSRQSITKLTVYMNMSYASCRSYYYKWKNEVLGIDTPTSFIAFPEPTFSELGESLVGKNGTYEVFANEVVLIRNGAAFNLGTKKDMLRIFNEMMAAYETFGID